MVKQAAATALPAPTQSVDIDALPTHIRAAIDEMSSDSGEFDYAQMVLDIMDATTVDDVLGSTVLHLKDMIGVPFTINRVTLQQSDYEESVLPKYAVIFATLDDDTSVVITTGASTVVTQCVKFHMEKWFPLRVSSSMNQSRSGYDVVKLVKPLTDKGF